jgi:hypothetical protein
MTSNAHSIFDLPLELWWEITSHLPNHDIKSLRLASKQFCNAVELRLQRVFLSANPLNIEVFRAVADHKKFRHQVTEIVWDDARLSRGPRRLIRLPGWESEAISDADISDNETEESIRRRGGSYDLDWDLDDSDDSENEDDEDDEEGGDPVHQLRRSAKFRRKDCPLWFKAACAANIEDLFWRQGNEDGVDSKSPDYKSERELGSTGPELGECWKLYRALVRQQDDVLAGNYDEEAFLYGIKQFPTLKKVTVTPAAHGVLYTPLYQTPMIRSFPLGFNYPIPRGWPMPVHDQPEEVFAFPWQSLDEKYKEKYHGFRIVTRALAQQSHGVIELSLDAHLLRTGINCTILDDPSEYDHLVTVLKQPGFRHLDVSFTIGGIERRPNWRSFPHSRLHQALSEAGDMEEISLSTTGIDAENEGKDLQNTTLVPLRSIFPIDKWPKLRHFQLSRFIVSQSDVLSFLSELPGTLRSVNLSFLVFVDNGNWHTFIAEMREEIHEKRLWPDRRLNVTIGCSQNISLPGRAKWLGKEIDEFLYEDGENPFLGPPHNMVKPEFGTEKDALVPNN